MIEIEFIGTGGQGSVVAGRLLGDAAARAGYKTQAFSAYGAQRRGGSVESYVRLSGDVIRNHSKIYGADYVIMMDKALIERSLREGKLRQGATVMINTSEPPENFSALKGRRVITLDANRIASQRGVTLPSGAPVINTTVLGALWALIPSVTIDQLVEALKEGKIPAVERNIAAVREAYETIQESLTTPGKKQAVADESPVIVDLLPEYSPKLSPCEAACPAGEKIERTALFVQYGHFEDALESIKAENPFPGICGRVCFHPCEDKCNRVQFDEGVATNALERAAFDYGADAARAPEKRPATGKNVAVIGSGPAGATCSYYLALLGHAVTIFEAEQMAGGVPRIAIPEYRLPKKIVDQELRDVKDLGVNIRLNTRVGKDIAFDTLRKEYDACFIATGAHSPMSLGIPGEKVAGVLTGIQFLRSVTFGEKIDLGTKVVVVGGGNSAVDSARTALRLGASEVTIAYRRSAEEMPAFREEFQAAKTEGVKIVYLAIPVRARAKNGRVSGLECVKAKLGEPDADGRRRPEPIAGSNFTIEADAVIAALGETTEVPFPKGALEMAGSLIRVDELGRTSLTGVYAGGDAASASRSVVEAIASGKRAALGIDLYLNKAAQGKAAPFRKGKEGAVSMGRYMSGDTNGENVEVVSFEKLNLAYFTEEPRVIMKALSVKTRLKDFSEVKRGFSKANAMAEAERCFHCGTCFLCEVCYISCPEMAVTLTDDGPTFSHVGDVCKSCGICIHECPRHAISWEGVA